MGRLHAAGATEIYCGLMLQEHMDAFSNVFALNARQIPEANLPGLEELKGVLEDAHSLGMRVYLTWNAHYTEEQRAAVLRTLPRVLDLGVDGVIVSDVPLVLWLARNHPKTLRIASALAGSFNSATAALYRDLGVGRITLPRHLGIQDIQATTAACPDMEFEVFVMSERCAFPNATCRFEHAAYRVERGPVGRVSASASRVLGRGAAWLTDTWDHPWIDGAQSRFFEQHGMMCCRLHSAQRLDLEGRVLEEGIPFRFLDSWHAFRDACGLCALYDLAPIPNVVAVKVVGRQSTPARKVQDTRLVRDALALLGAHPDRPSFVHAVRQVRRAVHPSRCDPSYCYYPPRRP